MRILHLSLTGVMQSYGHQSRYPKARDAGMGAPTLSAVIGMMASVCGINRDHPAKLKDAGFLDLDLAVRVDSAGNKERDFQTVVFTPPKLMGKNKIVVKEFLTDAKFTVGIIALTPQGENAIDLFLSNIGAPKNAPYLGRKSYTPLSVISMGVVEVETIEEFLATAPLLIPQDSETREYFTTMTTSKEGEQPSMIINDRPLSFDSRSREYAPRPISIKHVMVANPRRESTSDGDFDPMDFQEREESSP